MILLTNLLNEIDEKNKSKLINIDDWNWGDFDHLMNMKFEVMDDYKLGLKKPKISIYKKICEDDKEYFFMEIGDSDETKKHEYDKDSEEDKEKSKILRFSKFNDVIDYFDNYKQPKLDKNK